MEGSPAQAHIFFDSLTHLYTLLYKRGHYSTRGSHLMEVSQVKKLNVNVCLYLDID